MKNSVISLLSKQEVTKIKFSFGTISIDSSSFQQVKSKIQNNKIKVVYSPRLGVNRATYRYTHNKLFLGFRTIGGNANKEALIIHECTHAFMDIAGKAIQRNCSEAAAYIAQCLFFYYKNKAALSRPGVKPKFRSSLLRKAWEVTMKALKNSILSNKDIEPLLKEIAKHPLYKRRYLKNVAYDGV